MNAIYQGGLVLCALSGVFTFMQYITGPKTWTSKLFVFTMIVAIAFVTMYGVFSWLEVSP